MPSHDLTPERGSNWFNNCTQAYAAARCDLLLCCLLAECHSTKFKRNTEGFTGCRHCTHVLTHVVHSQTGSHAPSRIIPSCSPAARCDSSGGTIPHFGDSCTRQLSSLRNPTSSVTFEPFFHLRIRNMTGAEPSRVSVIYSCAINHLLSGRSGSKQVCWLCRLVAMPSQQPAPSRRMSAD